MPKAYSYVRFSSTRQRRGASEARQDESPEPWCHAHGYTLDASLRLRDLGRSGYHGDHVARGAMGDFLALVRRGQIEPGSVLLVEDLDRFSRQEPLTAGDHVRQVIDAGVDIVTLLDGERYSRERLATDLGLSIKLTVSLFRSHEESKRKSIRIRDNWNRKRDKARSGERITRRVPSWIDPDTGLVIVAKADVIRRLYREALTGHGACRIARTLNRDGVPPPGRGLRWSPKLVRYHLTSRTVLGEYQPHTWSAGRKAPIGDPIPDYHPAIVDRQTWLAVQRTLSDRATKGVVGRGADHANLFTRLLFNMYDGGRYFLATSRRQYKDRTYTHRRLRAGKGSDGVPGCMGFALDYDSFESAFFRWIKEVDPATLFVARDSSSKARELESLQGDVVEVEAAIRETRDAIKAAIARRKPYRELLGLVGELEDDLRAKAKRVETLKSELTTSEARVFADLREALADPDARATVEAAIRLLIDRIDLLPIPSDQRRGRLAECKVWVQVLFNNGTRHAYIIHQKGGTWSALRTRAEDPDDVHESHYNMHKHLLGIFISGASPEWRDRLVAWYVARYGCPPLSLTGSGPPT